MTEALTEEMAHILLKTIVDRTRKSLNDPESLGASLDTFEKVYGITYDHNKEEQIYTLSIDGFEIYGIRPQVDGSLEFYMDAYSSEQTNYSDLHMSQQVFAHIVARHDDNYPRGVTADQITESCTISSNGPEEVSVLMQEQGGSVTYRSYA